MIVAILLILVAGAAVACVFVEPGESPVADFLAITFLAGPLVVSLALFLLGYFVHEPALRWVIAAAIVVAFIAARRAMSVPSGAAVKPDRVQIALIVVVVVQIVAVAIACFRLPLLWDGLMIWELKARLAFVNGGHVPLSYLADQNMQWTHNEYPLLLPLTEAWIYLWMGMSHQTAVKSVFVLFYAAAAALMAMSLRRGDGRPRLLAAALLFFLPSITVSDAGSVITGYADFPIAVYYLGSVIFAIRFDSSGRNRDAVLAGVFAAATTWMKQDGQILWLVAMALIALAALRRRRLMLLPLVALPGIVSIAGWKMFLNAVHCPKWLLFRPVTLANLIAGSSRIGTLVQWLLRELVQVDRWSILWPLFVVFLFLAIRRDNRGAMLASIGAVTPLLMYLSVYVFTLMPYKLHVATSMPRLMISPALVALLAVTRLWRPASESTTDASAKPMQPRFIVTISLVAFIALAAAWFITRRRATQPAGATTHVSTTPSPMTCASIDRTSSPATRADLAVLLLCADSPAFVPPPASGTVFADVPRTHRAAAWIEELYRRRITGGCSPGYFCPDDPANRAQFAVMLLVASGENGSALPKCEGMFDDAPCGMRLVRWSEEAVRRGLILPCGPRLFCPADDIPRGDAAAAIERGAALRKANAREEPRASPR